jgi:hypothetical protein
MSMKLSWQKSQKTEPVKALPRSVMILLGTPKRCLMSDEFNCFFRRYFRNRSDFNPLGEFVYSNQDMFVAAWGSTKRSYSVEATHSEGP